MRALWITLSALATQSLLMAASDSKDLILVENGQPRATIVLSANPTVAAQFAAKELNEHLRRITGTELPITSDTDKVSGTRVSIGDTQIARDRGLKPEDFKAQEYLIDIQKDLLVLYGRDLLDAEGKIPKPFDERGSLDATYEFLQRDCGVRWFHPGDLGTITPRTQTVSVPLGKLRQIPDMSYLWMAEMNEIMLPWTGVPGDEVNLWHLRMRMGGEKYEANHSFEGYRARFEKDHPDWFQAPQPCYTNAGFIDQVTRDANEFFDGQQRHENAMAMGNYFGIVPGDNNWWCTCEVCKAELALHEKSDADQYFTNGIASIYYWNFANKVAKKVKETHPDKYLAALAYMTWAEYPPGIELESNISVQLCLQTRNWMSEGTRDQEVRIFKEWAKHSKERPFFVWLYLNFPAMAAFGEKYDSFPGYSAHHVIEWVKLFHEGNVRGIFLEHSSEFRQTHFLDIPDIYLMFTMARDSKLKGEEIFNDFFEKYYGAAAKPMRELYNEIEATYWDRSNYPESWGNQTEEIAWGTLGTPERMAKWRGLMEEARKLATNRADRARVEMFDESIWQKMEHGEERHPKLVKLKAEAVRPEATIPLIEEAGGDLAKVNWDKALTLDWFRLMTGEDAKNRTRALLAHDADFIYIQFQDDTPNLNLRSVADTWGDYFVLVFTNEEVWPNRNIMFMGDGKEVGRRMYAEGDGMWHMDPVVSTNYDPNLSQPLRLSIALPLASLIPGGAKPGVPFFMNLYRLVQGQVETLGWMPVFNHDTMWVRGIPQVILE